MLATGIDFPSIAHRSMRLESIRHHPRCCSLLLHFPLLFSSPAKHVMCATKRGSHTLASSSRSLLPQRKTNGQLDCCAHCVRHITARQWPPRLAAEQSAGWAEIIWFCLFHVQVTLKEARDDVPKKQIKGAYLCVNDCITLF